MPRARKAIRSSTADFGQQVERSARLSDKVAEAIMETILQRNLQAGDALPSERELGDQFGVSRTVVREAVRVLGSRGLVDARAGRGLTVAKVEAQTVSDSMRLYLHGQGPIPYAKINEVRATIEIQIAGLAAERASVDEVEELGQIADAMQHLDQEGYSQLDVEFHRALARMTHNELYLIMLDSIGPVLLAIRRATFALPGDSLKTHQQHRDIVDAVASRNADAAREAMRRHLEDAERDWSTLGNVQLAVP